MTLVKLVLTKDDQLDHMEIKQGLISDEVWNDPELVKYRNELTVYGYIGEFSRTTHTDFMVMRVLQYGQGFSSKDIANWMMSKLGGWTAADLGDKTYKNAHYLRYLFRAREEMGLMGYDFVTHEFRGDTM